MQGPTSELDMSGVAGQPNIDASANTDSIPEPALKPDIVATQVESGDGVAITKEQIQQMIQSSDDPEQMAALSLVLNGETLDPEQEDKASNQALNNLLPILLAQQGLQGAGKLDISIKALQIIFNSFKAGQQKLEQPKR